MSSFSGGAYHEGNTQYRCFRIQAGRKYRVTGSCHAGGRNRQFMTIITDVGQGEQAAFVEGIQLLQPQVAAWEAELRGEDVAVKADPRIDAAVERERQIKAAREKAETEMREEREAAARLLDEANPLWGTF